MVSWGAMRRMVSSTCLGVRTWEVSTSGSRFRERICSFQASRWYWGTRCVEQFQHPLGGADDVVVGEDVLVDLRTVDIDLDDLRLAGKGGRVQSHPVGEAAAHGDEQVALVTGGVGCLGAVHPDHAGGEGVRAGEAAAAHDGDGHRGSPASRQTPGTAGPPARGPRRRRT